MKRQLSLQNGIILSVSVERLGADIAVTVSGGNRPHIGSVAVSVPRLSLSGDGTISATTSVINMTGHKDNILSEQIASALSSHFNCTVSVSAGVHFEHITPGQMQVMVDSPQKVAAFIIRWLEDNPTGESV